MVNYKWCMLLLSKRPDKGKTGPDPAVQYQACNTIGITKRGNTLELEKQEVFPSKISHTITLQLSTLIFIFHNHSCLQSIYS